MRGIITEQRKKGELPPFLKVVESMMDWRESVPEKEPQQYETIRCVNALFEPEERRQQFTELKRGDIIEAGDQWLMPGIGGPASWFTVTTQEVGTKVNCIPHRRPPKQFV